jgi:Zn-dependent M16 (insulinase) family peptidase
VVASDAFFANNSTNRKSSQAFAIKLFGGLIGWRANKQDTVTTLTTKAKLLALAQAAKKSMYISKLLQKLIIDFND